MPIERNCRGCGKAFTANANRRHYCGACPRHYYPKLDIAGLHANGWRFMMKKHLRDGYWMHPDLTGMYTTYKALQILKDRSENNG